MKKILILDDEAPIRRMLRKLLERNDYEVFDAENGTHGIKQFKEHKPDLIITDIIMPEKEGLETIREIREINSDIKIIAISGGGATDPKIYLELAEKLGADLSFCKPLNNKELLSAVKLLLT